MLEQFFNPKSVTLIGATDRPGSVGLGIAKNLLMGKSKRRIFFVNPKKKKILGQRSYASIQDIPETIDLAIIAVPAPVVLAVAKECVKKKARGAVVVSSGFAEGGDPGKKRQQGLLELFKENGVPFLGPNCLGVVNPVDDFNGSFAPSSPAKGGIAFISQSGALIDALIDYSLAQSYGFSAMVSYGNGAGLAPADFFEHFAGDSKTKVIALYLEGLNDGQRFIRAASKAARFKPVVVLKGGVTQLGSRAALSHSASLTGNSQIYSAAFERAGLYEVQNLQELMDVSLAFSSQPRFQGGVGILTNAGALGVLAADACDRAALDLPALALATKSQLQKSGLMNAAMNFTNPLDILGDALSDRYEAALNGLLRQKNIGCCLIVLSFQIMTDVEKIVEVIIRQKKLFSQKAIVSCLAGGGFTRKSSGDLKDAGVPVFETPERAVLAAKALSF